MQRLIHTHQGPSVYPPFVPSFPALQPCACCLTYLMSNILHLVEGYAKPICIEVTRFGQFDIPGIYRRTCGTEIGLRGVGYRIRASMVWNWTAWLGRRIKTRLAIHEWTGRCLKLDGCGTADWEGTIIQGKPLVNSERLHLDGPASVRRANISLMLKAEQCRAPPAWPLQLSLRLQQNSGGCTPGWLAGRFRSQC